MKTDAFGSCPRLISDRVRVTLPAAHAEEAAAIADEDRDARHPEQFRPFLAAPGLLVTAAAVPRRMLDVGTGTGILALAGAIWGAAEVVAVDVKPDAVAAARANAVRNRLAARVRVASELPPTEEVGAVYEALGCRRAASRDEGEWEALLFVMEGLEVQGG